jgi:hypothetical protein
LFKLGEVVRIIYFIIRNIYFADLMKNQFMKLKTIVLLSFLMIIAASIPSCIELVDAEYSYQDNVIFIDAYALTEAGTSTVTISRSRWDDINYSIRLIPNAKVQLENIDTGLTIDFTTGTTGAYVCPPDFAVEEGEVWKLYIELEDGRKFESEPETVKATIPIDEIKSEYSTELVYNAAQEEFVPGHRISIDWQDPAGEENYYLWKYKTFEPLYVCKTCVKGIYRNGSCQPPANNFGPEYFDYLCDPDCWQIKYEEKTIIFEDRLSDGAALKNKEIVLLPFYRRPDILIEVQQLSLNESGYNYFKIINDLVSASGGLNAPPAAPLLGNLFNPDDPSEIVLGQFTAAGVSSKFIFIDRSTIQENPFRPDDLIILEPCASCPQSYPCEESLTRTSIEPEGWQ